MPQTKPIITRANAGGGKSVRWRKRQPINNTREISVAANSVHPSSSCSRAHATMALACSTHSSATSNGRNAGAPSMRGAAVPRKPITLPPPKPKIMSRECGRAGRKCSQPAKNSGHNMTPAMPSKAAQGKNTRNGSAASHDSDRAPAGTGFRGVTWRQRDIVGEHDTDACACLGVRCAGACPVNQRHSIDRTAFIGSIDKLTL